MKYNFDEIIALTFIKEMFGTFVGLSFKLLFQGATEVPAGSKTTLKTFFKFKWTQTLFVGKPPL